MVCKRACIAVLLALTACEKPAPPPTSDVVIVDPGSNTRDAFFFVGGTVSGLEGAGLVLALSSQEATVAQNGAFVSNTAVLNASAFAVTVKTQPNKPKQTCLMSSAGMIADADLSRRRHRARAADRPGCGRCGAASTSL